MTDIKVIAAVYGAIQGSKDVTTDVQQIVDQNKTSFVANNDTFGDPAPGYGKHFGMLYLHQTTGLQNTAACAEGQTVPLQA